MTPQFALFAFGLEVRLWRAGKFFPTLLQLIERGLAGVQIKAVAHLQRLALLTDDSPASPMWAGMW